jgi:hypothetical protein
MSLPEGASHHARGCSQMSGSFLHRCEAHGQRLASQRTQLADSALAARAGLDLG